MAREDDEQLELREYISVLWRRKWIIVATTVIVAAVALALSLSETKMYRATASVLLQTRTSERIFSPGNQQVGNLDQVATEIEVMLSRSVGDAVTAELGHSADVSIEAIGKTNVIAISADDTRPAEAARTANTFARTYIDQRRTAQIDDLLEAATQVQAKIDQIDGRLSQIGDPDPEDTSSTAERQTLLTERTTYSQQLSQLQLASSLTESGGAQLVSEASVPPTPFRPTPKRTGALGVIIGLMLGVGLAFLRDYLDDSLRTKEQAEATTGLSVVASIPPVSGWRRGDRPRLVSMNDPGSQAAEAYRSLRTSLQFLALDRPIHSVQVTSAVAGDGKTTTVANLAVSLARAGQRVVVVDCDLRRPRVHEFFDLPNEVGLTSMLLGQCSPAEALQRVPDEPNLHLIASGPLPPNPSELLSARRTSALLQSLAKETDIVLVDSPPILPVTDGVVLAGLVDATIVVATVGRATRRALHRAVETLRRVSAPLMGVVLNSAGGEPGYGHGRYGRYGGYGGYGYGSRASPSKAATAPRARRVDDEVRR
jgi:non-specific protein-tyrosine kinase